jgi:PAS domain S-box-containing protein
MVGNPPIDESPRPAKEPTRVKSRDASSHPSLWNWVTIALLCVAAAAILRIGLVAATNLRLLYLTFSPAIMTAALLAGWRAGVLATALSCLLALFFDWPYVPKPNALPTMSRTDEVTALVAFLLTSAYIVWLGDRTLRATRAERSATAERRRFQERLEHFIEAVSDGFLALDRDGNIVFANAQAARLTGRPAGQLLGRHFRDVYPDAVGTRVDQTYRRAVDTGEPQHLVELYPPLARWFEIHVYPSDDGLSIFFQDVTERLQAEERKARLLETERAAREEAERAGRMKDEFLATLSHELRTPLNAILGWATLLRAGGAGAGGAADDFQQGLETIERNARAQTQIVEDLLDMSRIISGKVRMDVGPVNLADVAAAAVEALRPAADARGLRLEVVLDPRTDIVSGDPARLQQVCWNILSNAVKFTPRGGKVQVVLARVNSHVELAVADTGQGIAPEFLPHVFERFRQADASSTRRHGGLGLGLAIAKHLIELHGGTIRAQSDGEGKGATFTISLPVAVVQRATDAPEQRQSAGADLPRPPAPIASLSGIKALVVDDDPDAQDLIRRVLASAGASVLAVGSANEALAALRDFAPDVLVSDIGMPDVDGYEFLRRARAAEDGKLPKTPAIALTAFARSEDRTRAMLAGYLMHIAKPVEPTELVAAVATAAGRTGA